MMRVTKRLLALCAVICLSVSSLAFAYQPEEALIPRPEKSVYSVLRLDNLGNFLRYLGSEKNVKLFAPLAGMGEDEAAMIAMSLAAVPAESTALVFGVDENETPFVQLVVKMPESLKAKLDLVANGEAKAEDLAAVLLGENSPVAPMGAMVLEVKKTDDGLLNVLDTLNLSAKGDLLIAALSAEDVKAALKALEDKDARLKIERRFAAKDFAITHVDADVLEKITPAEEAGVSKEELAEAKKMLDGPFETETAFESLADRFRISFAADMTALADKFENPNAKAVKGGYINLMGDRSPLLALGSVLYGETIKNYPGFKDIWTEAVDVLKNLNISEESFINFLTGSFALTIGNSLVSFEGMKVPAVFVTKEGQNGAAKEFAAAIAKQADKLLIPVEAAGWDSLAQVDSNTSPVSVLLGVKGEMLYAGMAEKDSLSEKPEIKGQLAEIMAKDSLGSFFMDFKGLQDYLKGDGANAMAMAGMFAPMVLDDKAEAVMAAMTDILDAKLSVPSVGLYAPSYGTCIMDFMTEEVENVEDTLSAKLIKLYNIINAPEVKDEAK
ncbi:MAG: hypothetical protein IJP88_10475 [Synergistaceae bacterium]|nr:hypothetical protein [Synergistaceae bacterium]